MSVKPGDYTFRGVFSVVVSGRDGLADFNLYSSAVKGE
jgi:hypothetical protein